ncbi:MBL fold metallo-hydrolase [Rhodobacteraceae bacterium M382]|nr:MBL fold metallo-hydrolase [Rhodobacteraceae bacterium M382]
MRYIKIAGLILVAVLLLVAAGGTLIGYWISAPISHGNQSRSERVAPFRDGRFVNFEPQASADVTVASVIEAFADHERTNPIGNIPVIPIDAERLQSAPGAGLRMAWLGHAGVLVEIDGVRILTDPVLSNRASPVSFAGPMRFHKPPIGLSELGGIDAVVISHNHYDHLDAATVRHLAKQGTQFFVPLANKAQLLIWGVPETQVTELDWWEEGSIAGLRIVATPTRHYSNRGTFDYKKTLWSSWSVIGPNNRFFYSGDTGYSKVFSEIGARFGPFDATIIKVGAYGPGDAWHDIHMTPEEAGQVHVDVKGAKMLPVHWATFNLAYHPWDEPIIRALAIAAQKQIDLVTPQVGEFVDMKEDKEFSNWWEDVE